MVLFGFVCLCKVFCCQPSEGEMSPCSTASAKVRRESAAWE